ncbi:MAG: hypothetical protein QMC40_09380 [Vicingaceae bacterium]
MKFDAEFKEAISHLPEKEKDKLIFRLLKKDPNLANRLHFELVNTESAEDFREKLETRIVFLVEQMNTQFYSIGYLYADVRFASGEINEHVQITKDKYGNASLNLLLINKVLNGFGTSIEKVSWAEVRTFSDSIIARAFKIILLINKMDEDYHFEFSYGLKELGSHLSKSDYLMKSAINNGFDVNWLLSGEIPEDIQSIYKESRANHLKVTRW